MGEVIEDEWENDKLAKVRNKVFHGHEGGVNSCCFLDNNDINQLVVSAGDDNTVRIWDTVDKSEKQRLLAHKDEVTCCKCSSDGKKIVSVGLDKHMVIWDIQTSQPVLQSGHEGMVLSCDISFDGKYILTTTDLDNAVYIWDLRRQKTIRIMKYHKRTVTSCQFAPNSYRFCTTSMDKTARVVDMLDYRDKEDPHEVLSLSAHSSMVSSCNFSSDSRRICTGSWDTTIMIWDVNAGSYRKDGPLVLEKGHHGCISACSFTKCGTALLSSSYEGNMLIWDVDAACKKLILQGHTDWVTDCEFSKDEKRIISSSKDGTLRYWKVEDYECLPLVMLNQDAATRLVQCQDCGKQYSFQHTPNTVGFQPSKTTDMFRRCVFCRQRLQEEEVEVERLD